MIDAYQSWRKIAAYTVLTFLISSVFYSSMYLTGSSRSVGVLWMWSPAISAILTQWMFRGSIGDFGWRAGPRKYLLLAASVPLMYALLIYGVSWATGMAGFRSPTIGYIVFLPVGFLAACLAALGEEIGWRGLLVPELFKVTTFTTTVLLSGLIWAIWHYPTILLTDYHSQAPRWFDLTTLTISVLGLSCFTAWLRLKSGSLWPAVIWHGAHNLFIQEMFLHMSTDRPLSKFVIDDFGLGLVLAALSLGFIFWKKRFEIPKFLSPQPGNAG
jgi:uncharacterized protein